MFACYTANAQWGDPYTDPPCYPDCEQSIWMPVPPAPAYSTTVNINCAADGGTMPVFVYYRNRYACNTWYDIYIERVEFFSPEACYECGHRMSLDEIMEAVMIKLIINNPMNYPPFDEGDCISNWRILKGSCWASGVPIEKEPGGEPLQYKPHGDWPQPIHPIYPCHFTICCLDYYEVCIQNGEKVITHTDTISGEDCPEDPTYPNEPCYQVCD